MQTPTDISKFENKRVLIVGDIMLDEFICTTSTRNSPEYKDVPVLDVLSKKRYLGGAANVALNIKKLKAIPYLVGTTGDDEAAKIIYQLLHHEVITNQYVHTDSRQNTTRKIRLFQDDKPVLRLDDETKTAHEELTNHFIVKNVREAIINQKPHVLILQDYNKGVLNTSTIPEILALAKAQNLLICVDPKFDNWNLYQQVDLFKPNKQELFVISEKILHNAESVETISKALFEKINFKNLLVTLGSEGNFISDGKISRRSTVDGQLQKADVCGAGDAVIAVAALALACDFALEDIAALSNKAGFIVCQKENVQPVTFEEL